MICITIGQHLPAKTAINSYGNISHLVILQYHPNNNIVAVWTSAFNGSKNVDARTFSKPETIQ